ncbi:MAG: DNA translocase FtsK 4TM domain-containing protein, partial [Armatimonadota bacterium]|nr:DNA translocase FtsK 4TM domain-containing protein [Armatimonadota bacterium]
MVRKAKRQRVKSYLPYDVAGVTLLFAGPIAMVSLAWTKDSGALGVALSNVLRGFAGIGAYILPFLLVALGLILLAGPLKAVSRNAAAGAILIFVVIITWQHLRVSNPDFDTPAYFNTDILQSGGGVIGGAVACALRTVIGNICSYILLVALAIISMLMITDVPLAHTVQWFARQFAAVAEAIGLRSSGRRVRQPLHNRASALDRSETVVDPRIREVPRDIPIITGRHQQEKPPQERQTVPVTVGDTESGEIGEFGEFKLPPVTLLKESPPPPERMEAELRGNIEIIERTLEEFKVIANVVEIAHGPTVTRYE